MKKLIKILHLSYACALAATYFFTIFFPLVFISGAIKDKKKRLRFIAPLWIIFGKIIMKFSCLAKVEIIDKRSDEEKNSIPKGLYIANHQSMMDIPLVLNLFCIPPIMKKELLKIPFFGLACKISTGIIVDRKDKNSRINVVRECQKRLMDGQAVQYYPEGTRSRLGHPKEYKDAKLKLVQFSFNNDIPVTTISIKGTDTTLDKYGFINPFHKVQVCLSQTINPRDFKSSEEFCEYCWKQVEENFKNFSA
jgi:1-acyl-sn-glycerol-3-phosphate acyltransferase